MPYDEQFEAEKGKDLLDKLVKEYGQQGANFTVNKMSFHVPGFSFTS
jgi:hypothetical protein